MGESDFAKRFPNLRPVGGAPWLWTVNGFGFGMRGKRDWDAETETYISTWCLLALFLPVFWLRAYRVADAEGGGMYFLGKDRVEGMGKWMNIVVLGAVLGIGVGVPLVGYWGSEGYKSRARMAEAGRWEEEGKLGKASGVYRELALRGTVEAENARAGMKRLMEKADGAEMGEVAVMLERAVEVARKGAGLEGTEVATRGLALVVMKGEEDAAAGVRALEAIRPLFVDPAKVDQRRTVLLKRWLVTEPGRYEAVLGLGTVMMEGGDYAGARKVMEGQRAKLEADGKGLEVWGMVLARTGDLAGAERVLLPHVKKGLGELAAAEKALGDTSKSLWEAEIDLLRNDKGPKDFYDKLEAAGDDQKQALVEEYVTGRLKGNEKLRVAGERLEKASAIVPIAFETGMVMLEGAQEETDGAARKARLTEVEQVFLGLEGSAGDSAEYKVSMGKVYYWLGKEEEGKKRFEEVLKDSERSSVGLLQVAGAYRTIGRVEEARGLAEEAYRGGKNNEEKWTAAGMRAVMSVSEDDRIEWLGRADPSSVAVRGNLLLAKGSKAQSEGRDEEAKASYAEAAKLYAEMPLSATSLNQGALANIGLFVTSGDVGAYLRAAEQLNQAVELVGNDSVLVGNAASIQLGSAGMQLMEKELDFGVLRIPGLRMMVYVMEGREGRLELEKLVSGSAGVKKAVGLIEREMLLSPKSPNGYQQMLQVLGWKGDGRGTEALLKRVREAGVDLSEVNAERKRVLEDEGEAEKARKATRAAVLRQMGRLEAIRGIGGATSGAGLSIGAGMLVEEYRLGGTEALDRAVELAREGYKVSKSEGTRRVLALALMTRALRDAVAGDQILAASWERSRRVMGAQEFVMARVWQGRGEGLLERADAVEAAKLMREGWESGTSEAWMEEYVLVGGVWPELREKLGAEVRGNRRKQASQEITWLLDREDVSELIGQAWMLEMRGEKELSRQLMEEARGKGLRVP